MKLTHITDILGGEEVLGKHLDNKMDLIELGKKGITKDAVSHLAKYLSISLKQISNLLPITERTLQRYTLKKHLNKSTSEQILQITEVIAKGIETFGNKKEFLLWLEHPNIALSNEKPFNFLDSRFGIELVLDELGRIEHGIYS